MIPDSMKHALSECSQLPSLPQAVIRVIELARDPDMNIREMVSTIGTDPALSVHLLSLANTVFYANQRPVEDLQQAVQRLGIERTLSLALGCSLITSNTDKSPDGLNLERYWQRSLISAMSARLLSERINLNADSSVIFTAALLQDIGVLGMLAVDYERYLSLLSQAPNHRALAQLELETYGTDHTSVGEWLAQKWKLSSRTVEWIRDSHAPLIDDDTSEQRAKNCIIASGIIADAWLQGEAALSEYVTEISIYFDLEADEMLAHLITLQEELPAISHLYNVTPPERLDPNRIMQEAKLLLLERTARLHDELLQKEHELERLRLQQKELALKATLDPLTNLYNRDFLKTALRQAQDDTSQRNAPLSVLFIDLDHFKEVNDCFGHEAGDNVLVNFANLLRHSIHDDGIYAARYGGDEFVVILPNHDEKKAHAFANDLKSALADKNVSGDMPVSVTASFGLATLPPNATHHDMDSLIREADRSMYQSKHAGRNRISVI